MILVFTGDIENNKAKFLGYCSAREEEAIIVRYIPIDRIGIERDLLKIKDEERGMICCVIPNQNDVYGSKEKFQELLNKYNNAIL